MWLSLFIYSPTKQYVNIVNVIGYDSTDSSEAKLLNYSMKASDLYYQMSLIFISKDTLIFLYCFTAAFKKL